MLREWTSGKLRGVVAGVGEGRHDQFELVKQVLAIHLVEPHLKWITVKGKSKLGVAKGTADFGTSRSVNQMYDNQKIDKLFGYEWSMASPRGTRPASCPISCSWPPTVRLWPPPWKARSTSRRRTSEGLLRCCGQQCTCQVSTDDYNISGTKKKSPESGRA